MLPLAPAALDLVVKQPPGERCRSICRVRKLFGVVTRHSCLLPDVSLVHGRRRAGSDDSIEGDGIVISVEASHRGDRGDARR